MNKKLKTLLAIGFSFMMMLSFAACGASDKETASTDNNNNNAGTSTKQVSQEDLEGAEKASEDGVIKIDVPTRNFMGTWTAESAKAEYLFGNLTITLNDDNTWTGVVTDENLYGTWEEKDFGVHLYDEVELWECDLFYTEKDNFVLNEDGIKIVLTRQ